MIEFFILFFALLIYFTFFKSKKQPKNFPPGPKNYLPIIGPFIQLGLKPNLALQKVGKKYNGIFSFNFGTHKAVIIDNFKLHREAMQKVEFNGRPYSKGFLIREEDHKFRGIIFGEGDGWNEQRKFAIKTLRDHGMGKKKVEIMILEEVIDLIEEFKKDAKSGPIDIKNKFDAPIINAIWILMAGEKRSHADKELLDIVEKMKSDMLIMAIPFQFPWTFEWRNFIPVLGAKINSVINNVDYARNFFKNVIKNHENTFQSGDNRDLIDSYIETIQKTTDNKSSFYKEEGAKNLVKILDDLYIAGAETTSTTCLWGFLLLALHSEIQDKLFEEIKSVIGLSRHPNLEDRTKMPYWEAVINEILRVASVIPLIIHAASSDIQFNEFFIPKNTMIIPNIYAMNHDEKVWKDPQNFRPERFLSEDRSTFVKNEGMVVFSTGKRNCIGEQFAKDQFFFFFAMTFQQFKIYPDPNSNFPKNKQIDYDVGMSMQPKIFPLIFEER